MKTKEPVKLIGNCLTATEMTSFKEVLESRKVQFQQNPGMIEASIWNKEEHFKLFNDTTLTEAIDIHEDCIELWEHGIKIIKKRVNQLREQQHKIRSMI